MLVYCAIRASTNRATTCSPALSAGSAFLSNQPQGTRECAELRTNVPMATGRKPPAHLPRSILRVDNKSVKARVGIAKAGWVSRQLVQILTSTTKDLISPRAPLSNPHAQTLMPCDRSRFSPSHGGRLRRAIWRQPYRPPLRWRGPSCRPARNNLPPLR